MRKPLTKIEIDELNGVLERAAQRLERRKHWLRQRAKEYERFIDDDMDRNDETLKGVLAALRDEPRDE